MEDLPIKPVNDGGFHRYAGDHLPDVTPPGGC
jgi:hypothetical protein